MTDVLIDPVADVDEQLDEGPMAHLVTPPEAVTEAYINGSPVVALCGFVWVPHRDPEQYPLCQRCVEVAKERWPDA